ncbi:MAG: hypothetical protein INR64_08520 [Caulobacteraceae bacterium]|nr:hypothetical protein [Caulobacter sp.]
MGQLLVRNLSDSTIAGVKKLAAEHGRSVEAEHRAILDQAVASGTLSETKAAWIARLKASRDETAGRIVTPSEVLVREMRDER